MNSENAALDTYKQMQIHKCGECIFRYRDIECNFKECNCKDTATSSKYIFRYRYTDTQRQLQKIQLQIQIHKYRESICRHRYIRTTDRDTQRHTYRYTGTNIDKDTYEAIDIDTPSQIHRYICRSRYLCKEGGYRHEEIQDTYIVSAGYRYRYVIYIYKNIYTDTQIFKYNTDTVYRYRQQLKIQVQIQIQINEGIHIDTVA